MLIKKRTMNKKKLSKKNENRLVVQTRQQIYHSFNVGL